MLGTSDRPDLAAQHRINYRHQQATARLTYIPNPLYICITIVTFFDAVLHTKN